ncbi:glycosyltransferase [Planktothrix agardhii]|uniref:glycosyltransferase n=1 Tax=Planktothrix agardhii TaxID=1160 RepID=UPI002B21FE17|nr:glycosyltransferase [Planktothrix agardhii]MEA5563658.1 glycosyltransferase [Planktothrix agardhii UHCC 0887]
MVALFDKKYTRNSQYSVCMIVANAVQGDSRVLKTAFSLSKNGYRVQLLGLNIVPKTHIIDGYPFKIKLIANPRFRMKKEESWWITPDTPNISLFIDRMVSAFFDAIQGEHYDFLHTHDMYGLPIGTKLRERCKIGETGWIHDLHEYVEGCTNLPEGTRAFLWQQEKDHIVKPDALTTVSPILSTIISEKYKLHPPSLVLNTPRLGDFDQFYPKSLRHALGIQNGIPLLVYNGGVKPPRGVQYAVNALPLLPNVHLALVTNSTGKFMDELLSIAKNNGCEKRLHIHSFVPHYDVTSFIHDVTVGINPVTIYENSDLALPNKVFEYIHAGIPVVSTATTAMKDFVAKYNCGVTFPAKDIEGFADAVKRTLLHYPKGLLNAGQGSKLAQQYCWEEQEKVILGLYEQMLARNCTVCTQKPSDDLEPILHLPTHAANQPGTLSKSLTNLGIKTKHATLGLNSFRYTQDISIVSQKNALVSINSYLVEQKLDLYNTYHYHCRPLLHDKYFYFPTGLDLLLLKAMKKRVFYHFRGSDVRLASIFKEATPYNYVDEQLSCNDKTMPFCFTEIDQKAFRDFVLGVCDNVFVNDPELQCYVPNSLIVPRAIDFTNITNEESKSIRSIPLIVHAPSRSGVKGSQYVLNAIEQLKQEGLAFDFKLVQNMPHEEAMAVYRDASIIVDQLRIGWYGVLAVEGMAIGKAVVSYIRNDLRHYLPYPPPLAYANPENITNVLRYLLLNPDAVASYGEAGQKFAREYHNADTIAKNLIDIYRQPIQPIDPVAVANFIEFQMSKKSGGDQKDNINNNQINSITDSNLDEFYLFHQRKGDECLAKNDFESAFTHYKRSLELNPNNFLLISKIADYTAKNLVDINLDKTWEGYLEQALIKLGENQSVYDIYEALSITRSKLIRSKLINFNSSIRIVSVNESRIVSVNESSLTINKELPKIILLTCVWARHELTKIFLEYYQSLKNKLSETIDLILVAVGSEGQKSYQLCEECKFEYYEHPNNFVSDKWEYAIQLTKSYNPDGVIIMGSDDFVNEQLILRYIQFLNEGVLFAGLTDSYFFDIQSTELIYWKGYGGKIKDNGMPERLGESIGTCRLLSKKLLEILDYSLWKDVKIDKYLENHVTHKLNGIDMLPVKYQHKIPVEIDGKFYYYGHLSLTMAELGAIAVGIKYPRGNLSRITNYLKSADAVEKINDPWLFLEQHFPPKTVDRLKELSHLIIRSS